MKSLTVNRCFIAGLSLCVLVAVLLGLAKATTILADAPKVKTLGILGRGELLEGYEERIAIYPLVSWKDGRWVSLEGGKPEEEMEAALLPLKGVTFFSMDNPKVRFHTNAILRCCCETDLYALGGEFPGGGKPTRIPEWTSFPFGAVESGWLLTTDFKLRKPSRKPVAMPIDEAWLSSHINAQLESAVESEQQRNAAADKPSPIMLVIKEDFVINDRKSFRVKDGLQGVWVSASRECAKMREGRTKAVGETDAVYHAVIGFDASKTPMVLWEEGCVHIEDEADPCQFWVYVGACDVNGDGAAELVLAQHYYERGEFQVYELQRGRYEPIASAASRGI